MWSNHPKLTQNCPVVLQESGSKRFGEVERPKLTPTFSVGLLPPLSQWFKEVRCIRTSLNSNLPCMPASPLVTVVQGGSVRSNCPKLTPTFPVGLLPRTSQWFEKVRYS